MSNSSVYFYNILARLIEGGTQFETIGSMFIFWLLSRAANSSSIWKVTRILPVWPQSVTDPESSSERRSTIGITIKLVTLISSTIKLCPITQTCANMYSTIDSQVFGHKWCMTPDRVEHYEDDLCWERLRRYIPNGQ